MKKHINLNMSTDELKEILSAHIVPPYSNMIAETIIDGLSNTDRGLYHLIRALLGKKYVPKFKVLDKVLVRADQLATWRYNLDEMKSKDIIVKDYIEAQITEVNIHKTAMYEVKYICVMTNTHTFTEDTYLVAEEYIMDIPHELPELSEPDNDTIPF